MPAGRGHKGSKVPPKKKPKVQPDSRVPFSVVAGVQDKECNPISDSSSVNLLDFTEELKAASSASVETEIDSSHIGPSGMPQTRYENVYYHCNIPCIRTQNIHFESSMLRIPATVLVQLLPAHT